MYILALDLGTKCGWADSKGYSGVWHLKPSTHESAGERYRKFEMFLKEEISSHQINFIVYEEVHRHIGTEAAHVYGGLMAILQLICCGKGIEYKGVGVGTIKKHATGSGSASKEEMIKSAIQKFKRINVVDDNHADALHLLDYAQKIIFPTNELGL